MILQQHVRQFFRESQDLSSSLVLPIIIDPWSSHFFACGRLWPSVLTQEFESECSDNLGLLQLLTANSISWAFESYFSLSTVSRNLWSQSLVILAEWELPKMGCSSRKTCQVMIAEIWPSHLKQALHEAQVIFSLETPFQCKTTKLHSCYFQRLCTLLVHLCVQRCTGSLCIINAWENTSPS